ncbi:MAG: hypothetical protein M0Z46_15110, partial [Actinomycetota bacterium]|nr:hypothetical protein [Actinomycetota bacterium]
GGRPEGADYPGYPRAPATPATPGLRLPRLPPGADGCRAPESVTRVAVTVRILFAQTAATESPGWSCVREPAVLSVIEVPGVVSTRRPYLRPLGRRSPSL